MRLDRDTRRVGHASVHFPGLDGLRGIAAFVVAYLHANLTFHFGYLPGTASLAVDFFFMLSGFVLAYAYDSPLRDGMTWPGFMRVRLIRLYPMLFVGNILGAVMFIVIQHQRHLYGQLTSIWMIAGSFLMLPVGVPVDAPIAYPLNIAYWSLFFELIASAAFATRWGQRSPRILAFAVLICAVAMGVMTFESRPYIENGVTSPDKFLWGFVRAAYPFAAGLLLYRSRYLWGWFSQRTTAFGSWWPIAAILTGMLLLPIDNPWCDIMLSFVVFPLLIIKAASLDVSAATARVCTVIGRLSYPIYILHWPLYRLLNGATQMLRLHISPRAEALAGAAVTLLLAQITLVVWDEPVRRWLLKQQWLQTRGDAQRGGDRNAVRYQSGYNR